MEFLTKLHQTEDSLKMKFQILTKPELRGMTHYRMLKGLVFNNGIVLSVQASYGHYCTPRETLELSEYSRMEIALMINGFINVREALPDSPLADEFEEYDAGGVYGYVPVELIEKLYQALKETHGLAE